MGIKFASFPGIGIMILAHAGSLTGCAGDVVQAQPLGDGDGTEEVGDGDLGDPTGNGDGDDLAPIGDGDGDGESPGCPLILLNTASVLVIDGAHADGTSCRVAVAFEEEEMSVSLDCVASGNDCMCSTFDPIVDRGSAVFNISEDDTLLGSLGPFEPSPPVGECGGASVYVGHEFQYVAPAPTATDIASLYSDFRKLISTESCESTDDCAAVALGSKPCGGPWDYLVYSKLSTDEDELLLRAEELATAENLYNAAAGVSSDCGYEVEPEVLCMPEGCTTIQIK